MPSSRRAVSRALRTLGRWSGAPGGGHQIGRVLVDLPVLALAGEQRPQSRQLAGGCARRIALLREPGDEPAHRPRPDVLGCEALLGGPGRELIDVGPVGAQRARGAVARDQVPFELRERLRPQSLQRRGLNLAVAVRLHAE